MSGLIKLGVELLHCCSAGVDLVKVGPLACGVWHNASAVAVALLWYVAYVNCAESLLRLVGFDSLMLSSVRS